MSNTEKNFEKFLQENHINYIYQYVIDNVPFTASHKHAVDFYLPEYDLCVEVKGFMTHCATTILNYLLESYPKNFYILQVTEEDWIEPYDPSKHPSKASKLRSNVANQYSEILEMKAGKVAPAELQQRSISRLSDYIFYFETIGEEWKGKYK